MIELKSITKTFVSTAGSHTALNDVSLTVSDGEIFGIIGLSGAGKSTLVRCINLLERPDLGEVIIDGTNVMSLNKSDLLKLRRNIGMIFQSFNLLEQRSVLGNVLFPLEIAGVKKADAEAKALELLELVGLSEKAKAYPAQLSGGQKQRVAIARALATDPKYLLCDEATSALDPTTTVSILELLKRINRTLGVTIIVITHEMDVIDRICDRVAVLDKSKVAEIGAVSAVFTDPKSDIAKALVLPKMLEAVKNSSGKHLRLVFDGESSEKPVISSLVTECGAKISILFADMKELDGKNYGQMLISIPDNESGGYERSLEWLKANGVRYSEEDLIINKEVEIDE